MNPLTFLLVCVAGWMNRQQQLVIEPIQGALANLHHEVGRDTIADVLREAGLGPSPERRKGTTWNTFLTAHGDSIAATDFFSVEVWTASGLVRYHVLFVIRLVTWEVHIAGIIPEPHGPWMDQMARNLTDASDGFLRGCRFMIHDRSSLFTAQFRDILKCAGVDSIQLPARSPNPNAFAERFVKTIKNSCLDTRIFFGESSLRKAVSEFVSHYHTERNHQARDSTIIRAEFSPLPESGPIKCWSRLGGQLHYYYREAA